MNRSYFGTDGVRSVAGQFPLTAPWVLALGVATAEVLRETHRGGGRPSVVLGKDTRHSGDMLEAALAAGLTSRGVDVVHLGVLPTPGVSYLTRYLKADAGVVISASHNPYQDNGIKFFGEDGKKLSDDLEGRIEAGIGREELTEVTGTEMGSVTNYSEAERIYTNFLRSLAPDLRGMRIAMDCANGAAYRTGPKVFQAAGADLFAIFTTPDGHNINRGCGSTHLEALQTVVQQGAYDCGVAFDGDADRCLLLDSQGRVLQGDHLLLLLARARGEREVVGTLMSNMALEVALQQEGRTLHRAAVGDRYVHEQLHERGLSLGGEQSGHLLFLDVAPTGDGVMSALLTLAALRKLGMTADALHDALPMYPQTLHNVPVTDKKAAMANPAVQAALREAEARMAGRGRVNLRPSGTEMLVRVMVEGPDAAEAEAVAREVAAAIRAGAGAAGTAAH